MSSACSVCSRADRGEINAALAGGMSACAAARRWGVPPSNLKRHARHWREREPPPVSPRPVAPLGPLVRGEGSRCAACASPHREAITQAIRDRVPPAEIERRWGIPARTTRGHALRCMTGEERRRLAGAPDGESTRERLEALARDCAELAEETYDPRDRVAVLRETREILTLLARMGGELGGDSDLRIAESALYKRTVDLVITTLRPWPVALRAIADAFETQLMVRPGSAAAA